MKGCNGRELVADIAVRVIVVIIMRLMIVGGCRGGGGSFGVRGRRSHGQCRRRSQSLRMRGRCVVSPGLCADVITST